MPRVPTNCLCGASPGASALRPSRTSRDSWSGHRYVAPLGSCGVGEPFRMKRWSGPSRLSAASVYFEPSVVWCGGSALFDDAFEAIELADLVVHGPLDYRAHEPLETAQVGVEIEADASAAFGG